MSGMSGPVSAGKDHVTERERSFTESEHTDSYGVIRSVTRRTPVLTCIDVGSTRSPLPFRYLETDKAADRYRSTARILRSCISDIVTYRSGK